MLTKFVKSKECLLDDEDEKIFDSYRWRIDPRGHLTCKKKGFLVFFHRLILGLSHEDKGFVCHLDGNPLNNTKINLKVGTIPTLGSFLNGIKICQRCDKKLTEDKFYKLGKRKDGLPILSWLCRKCLYQNYAEKFKQKAKEWYKNNKERAHKKTAKTTCLNCKKGFLTEEWQIKRGRKYCSIKCIPYERITPIKSLIRASNKYQRWRRRILERDKFTCQQCKRMGGILHVDHIKPFAYFPELIYEMNNARTLCVDCHKKTETYMGKARSLFKNFKRNKHDLALAMRSVLVYTKSPR